MQMILHGGFLQPQGEPCKSWHEWSRHPLPPVCSYLVSFWAITWLWFFIILSNHDFCFGFKQTHGWKFCFKCKVKMHCMSLFPAWDWFQCSALQADRPPSHISATLWVLERSWQPQTSAPCCCRVQPQKSLFSTWKTIALPGYYTHTHTKNTPNPNKKQLKNFLHRELRGKLCFKSRNGNKAAWMAWSKT